MTDRARYFDTGRREVLGHLPPRVGRMLDLGCGTGATVALIRGLHPGLWAAGVELDPGAAAAARARVDRLWEGDVERLDLERELGVGTLDLVLCLDVLEHLVDPWSVVRRLSPLLAPGGRLILSVPNIRNWKFLWRLAVRGDFHYTDQGLLDRTHLRFFVRPTAEALASCGGLRLVGSWNATSYARIEARFWLSRAGLEPLLAKQWVVVAQA